jgi:hypothetical protein
MVADIMFTDKSWEIRALAAHALHRLKDPAAVPALTQALADPDFCVHSTARHALADLDGSGSWTSQYFHQSGRVEADPVGFWNSCQQSAALNQFHPTRGTVALPEASRPLPTKTVQFAYADLGAGSHNLALSCDLAGALDADIIYCVGHQQVTEVVSQTKGRFVLFTNFSLKEVPPGQITCLSALSKTMRRLVTAAGFGCRPPPSPLDADPAYGPVRLFLFGLLQRQPQLHIHVITRAAPEIVRDEDILSLAPAGQITVKRVGEFGVPTDYAAFIRYVIERLRESYGRDDFVRVE